MRREVLFNITSDAIILFNRTAFVWIAARANVIIVMLRFVKFKYFFFCHVVFVVIFASAEYCITLCSNFFFSKGWQNQNTWEINFGTAALARYNNYAACRGTKLSRAKAGCCAVHGMHHHHVSDAHLRFICWRYFIVIVFCCIYCKFSVLWLLC